MDRLPGYHELPVRDDAPPGSSWGLWGPDDELGALNLLTDERTLAAVHEVNRGAVFPLGLPLEHPNPGLAWRTPVVHRFLRVGHEAHGNAPDGTDEPASGFSDRDDYLDGLWLQGSSQWDGLAHVRHPQYGNYNGIADSEIHGGHGARLGVDRWASRGIVGRGVLIDMPRYYAQAGINYDVRTAHSITVADLRRALEAEQADIRPGDIPLLYTGWMQHYLDADQTGRERIMDFRSMTTPGLEPSAEMVAYLWDLHIAAIASDTNGVEAINGVSDYYLHSQLLPLLGIPLGEYFVFPELVADCAADGRYGFLFVSVPLNVTGGIGSPPQAIAIK